MKKKKLRWLVIKSNKKYRIIHRSLFNPLIDRIEFIGTYFQCQDFINKKLYL
jgi:hypothetical protein